VIVSLPPEATFDENNVVPIGSSDCEVEKHGDETEEGNTVDTGGGRSVYSPLPFVAEPYDNVASTSPSFDEIYAKYLYLILSEPSLEF
jgi:hypothetical protein